VARTGAHAGRAAPGPLGGDRRSARIEAQGGLIRELLETTPDITTEELRAALAELSWFTDRQSRRRQRVQ
jgi:hypothetical protein